jgi:hypothetical protein
MAVEVLKIDQLLARVKEGSLKNRVYRVGLELEGGWDELPPGVHDIGNALVHDGSVNIPQQSSSIRAGTNTTTIRVGRFTDLYFTTANFNSRGEPDGFLERNDPVPGTIYTREQANEMSRMNERGENPYTILTQPLPHRIHVGELPSKILQLSEISNWLKVNYPQHVHKSCGFHIHMSFRKALHYERLMVPEYQETILAYLSKWAKDEGIPQKHHIWERLTGKNTFCKKEFFADAQVVPINKNYNHTGASRYTAINYCYGQHGTIECRVLPMLNTAEQADRAVKQVINITNACIKMLGKKESKISASLISDSMNLLYESREEMV